MPDIALVHSQFTMYCVFSSCLETYSIDCQRKFLDTEDVWLCKSDLPPFHVS